MTVLILGMMCWACWASTYKMAGAKWRFELYYIDFTVGVLTASLLAGLTFGSLGWDGFSLMDDLRLAGKRQELFGFLAGCVFNLANILLLASVSLTGLAISFPITMGVALITGTMIALATNTASGILFLTAGCTLVLVAVTLTALAWKDLSAARLAVVPEFAKPKAQVKSVSFKGIVVALVGGLLMGSFYPLVGLARAGENGLGPYSVCVVFAVGVFMSTLVFNLFFMNLPLQGKPVEMSNYFRGGAKQHLLGLLGGMLWLTGLVCVYVAERAEGSAQPGQRVIWLASQGAAVLSALLGILAWKELSVSGGKARSLIAISLFLYLGGVGVVSMASAYGAR